MPSLKSGAKAVELKRLLRQLDGPGQTDLLAKALDEARAEGMRGAADIVWANRWEPPYTLENRMVAAIRSAASGESNGL